MSGQIPVPITAVNQFVTAQIAQRDTPVSSVQIDAQGNDTFTAHVVPRARFLPSMTILARIERQPELPGDPVLWLRWSIPGIGKIAFFAAPALALFRALPQGIRADADRIGIDVREVLASRGLGDLVGYLRSLRVHTRPGVFLAEFEVRVD